MSEEQAHEGTTIDAVSTVQTPPVPEAWPPAPTSPIQQGSAKSRAYSFVSTAGRAKAVIGLLGFIIFCDIVATALGCMLYLGPKNFVAQIGYALAILCSVGIGVITGILFFMWLYRSYNNLYAFDVDALMATPKMAIGWWYVPFFNLYMPYQVVNELWLASDPKLTFPTGSQWKGKMALRLIAVWWLMWILQNICLNVASNSLESSANPLTPDLAGALVMAPNAVAAALAILVVRQITQRQEERGRQLAAAGEAAP